MGEDSGVRLNVPFFQQTTSLNCGPCALKMVLEYFGEKYNLEVLEKECGLKDGSAVWTTDIATGAASLGYGVNFYSKHVSFNPENLELDYYKEYAKDDWSDSEERHSRAIKAGVKITEKSLSLEEVLNYVNEDSIPIVLLNWDIVGRKEGKGYQGHFVPIVGYDKKNVYVHDHGLGKGVEFMAIERKLFDKSRKSPGTDEDLIVIHRKIN